MSGFRLTQKACAVRCPRVSAAPGTGQGLFALLTLINLPIRTMIQQPLDAGQPTRRIPVPKVMARTAPHRTAQCRALPLYAFLVFGSSWCNEVLHSCGKHTQWTLRALMSIPVFSSIHSKAAHEMGKHDRPVHTSRYPGCL